tara:strand:+ start:600 stop:749 length:150 start_codon:yes stop_codon:yes gene_type:complete
MQLPGIGKRIKAQPTNAGRQPTKYPRAGRMKLIKNNCRMAIKTIAGIDE